MMPPETAREYPVSKSITSHHFLSHSLYAQRDYVFDHLRHVDIRPAPGSLNPIFTLGGSLNESAYVCKAPPPANDEYGLTIRPQSHDAPPPFRNRAPTSGGGGYESQLQAMGEVAISGLVSEGISVKSLPLTVSSGLLFSDERQYIRTRGCSPGGRKRPSSSIHKCEGLSYATTAGQDFNFAWIERRDY